MANSTFVCIGCRVTAKRDHFWVRPPKCYNGHSMINMGSRWRAPKWHNHRAWQRIAVGDIWWEDKAPGKGIFSAPYVSPKQRNDISQHMQQFRDDWMNSL